jgi:hypothetical protein
MIDNYREISVGYLPAQSEFPKRNNRELSGDESGKAWDKQGFFAEQRT